MGEFISGEPSIAGKEVTLLEGVINRLRLFHDELNTQIYEVVKLRRKFVSYLESNEDVDSSKEISNEYVHQYPDVLETLNSRLQELTKEIQELKRFI